MRRTRALLALAAAAVAVTAPDAGAALCPAGYTGATQVLDTGYRAGQGARYGAPDLRWVALQPTAVPTVETTAPAWSVRPAPGWIAPTGATWISTTGATTGTPTTAPAGLTTYRTVFAAPATGSTVVSLSYAGDDEIRWYLNGMLMAYYIPPPTAPTSGYDRWHTLTIDTHVRSGHNILDAGVTNRGGYEGLVVRGSAVSCVPT